MRLLPALVTLCCISACRIEEPLPEPSLSYSATFDGEEHHLDYYWDNESLSAWSTDGLSTRFVVTPERRDELLDLFSDDLLARYLADLNLSGSGTGAPIPNCPGSDAQVQTICSALELSSEKIFVSVIHPDDEFLESQSFLYEAPTTMSFETAEMLVSLTKLFDDARSE